VRAEFLSTMEEGEHARDYHLYDVLTALRGPDSGYSTVKSVLTERLRGIVFTLNECPGDYRTDSLTSKELEELKTQTGELSHHIATHLRRAVSATRNHPIWGGFGEQVLEALDNR
jgi:hypothetical protein